MPFGEPVPLRNIPISITVDGVIVSGVIVGLHPNDISVEITEPFSGFGSGLHIPHFAMGPTRCLATLKGRQTAAITERGRHEAEWLLRRLYEHARGNRAGWPVDAIGSHGWTRIEDRE